MAHSTKDVAGVLGVSTASVRTYTQRFAEFLSSEATPEPGQRRRFTDDDLAVLHVARQMLREGATYEQVRERLAQGVQNLVDVYGPAPSIKGETQPEPSREIVAVEQLRAWVAPLESAVEAWRSLAEERGREVEVLREALRRLRETPSKRPWWRFWAS